MKFLLPLTIIALSPLPALAQDISRYGTPISSEDTGDVVCYMQNSHGDTLDLSHLCSSGVRAVQPRVARNRVTKALASKVQVGMTLEEVNQTMGFAGKKATSETTTTTESGSFSVVIYTWENSTRSYLSVAFVDGRATRISQEDLPQ